MEPVYRVRVLAYSMEEKEHLEWEDWTILITSYTTNSNTIRFTKMITPLSKNVEYWLILPSLPQHQVYGILVQQELSFKEQVQDEPQENGRRRIMNRLATCGFYLYIERYAGIVFMLFLIVE